MINKKPSKAHLICFVLSYAGVPLTREETLRRVHILEGKASAFRPKSNHCYFSPVLSAANGAHNSLICKGLIQTASLGRNYTYALTWRGKQIAKEYLNFVGI